MTGPLYRLGGVCARHHWPVIAAWLVAVAAVVAIAAAAGEQNSDDLTLPGTESTRATDRLQADLPKQAYGTNPVVLEATSGKLTDSSNKQAVDKTVDSLKGTDHVIRVGSPLEDDGSGALSKDKRIGYISVTLDLGPSDLSKDEAE
jgi:RND superfamily putative drug exporter